MLFALGLPTVDADVYAMLEALAIGDGDDEAASRYRVDFVETLEREGRDPADYAEFEIIYEPVGRTCYEAGDAACARRVLEHAEQLGVQSPYVLFTLAELHEANGNPEAALSYYERCVAVDADTEFALKAGQRIRELRREGGELMTQRQDGKGGVRG